MDQNSLNLDKVTRKKRSLLRELKGDDKYKKNSKVLEKAIREIIKIEEKKLSLNSEQKIEKWKNYRHKLKLKTLEKKERLLGQSLVNENKKNLHIKEKNLDLMKRKASRQNKILKNPIREKLAKIPKLFDLHSQFSNNSKEYSYVRKNSSKPNRVKVFKSR